MKLTMTIAPEQRRILVRASGAISLDDILDHIERERAEGVLSYSELVDARGARPDFSGEQLRGLVGVIRQLARASRFGPTAIMVDTDLAFGTLRMLEMLVDDVFPVRPFREQAAAERWLNDMTQC